MKGEEKTDSKCSQNHRIVDKKFLSFLSFKEMKIGLTWIFGYTSSYWVGWYECHDIYYYYSITMADSLDYLRKILFEKVFQDDKKNPKHKQKTKPTQTRKKSKTLLSVKTKNPSAFWI